jgi:hypothetical protein
MLCPVGSGYQWMTPRNWEWFLLYYKGEVVPQTAGIPIIWAQSQQGASGVFSVHPVPDAPYVLNIDAIFYPIPLVDDTTTEAIPVAWTEAVPYFAAYMAYLTVQNGERAKAMLEMYSMFMERARRFANPSVNRYLYQQAVDPTMIAKLGLQQKSAAN